MKLATLKEGGRDGTLIVVNKKLTHGVRVPEIASTLQQAIDNWQTVYPALKTVDLDLNHQQSSRDIFLLDLKQLAAPLPRAYQWLDGSAYLNHVELARRARGAELPEKFWEVPLMYQGISDNFLSGTDAIRFKKVEWGIDFESELAIITDDVPISTGAEAATKHIKLLMLVNDISLRNLIPKELDKGFGFLQSKPACALSPVVITPDELGDDWSDGKVHLPLKSYLNDKLVGEPNAGEGMAFNFNQLIEHAAKTRPLGAGTVIGSGTVSNADISKGSSCIVEKRILEFIESGISKTPFLQIGDRVRIEMHDASGNNLFGSINQSVESF